MLICMFLAIFKPFLMTYKISSGQCNAKQLLGVNLAGFEGPFYWALSCLAIHSRLQVESLAPIEQDCTSLHNLSLSHGTGCLWKIMMMMIAWAVLESSYAE